MKPVPPVEKMKIKGDGNKSACAVWMVPFWKEKIDRSQGARKRVRGLVSQTNRWLDAIGLALTTRFHSYGVLQQTIPNRTELPTAYRFNLSCLQITTAWIPRATATLFSIQLL